MKSTRDGRKAYTFWFSTKLSEQLKQRAGRLSTTTTELINRSVKLYLEKGYLYDDDEASAMQSSMDIADEVGYSALVNEKVNPILGQLKGISSRIDLLEKKHLPKLDRDSIDSIVRQQIRLAMLDKVNPILEKVLSNLENLDLSKQKSMK